MRRSAALLVSVALLAAGLFTATPAGAAVPDAPYTDTSCDGYSDAVARLYVAAFGRTPELNGFNFWVDEYSKANWSLPEMAAFFLSSTEFEERYGAVDDSEFVTQLYQNVLDRSPDAGGLAFWVGELAAGMTRDTLLLRFSESPENVERSGTTPPKLGDFNAGTTEPFECDPPDVIELCNAYLAWLITADTSELAAALGSDAPVGVLAAIDTLNDPDAELDDIFSAIDSLEGYVGPICRDRWANDLEPAASDAAAVEAFFNGLVAGDDAAVSAVAPDDVVAVFRPLDPIAEDSDVGSPSLDYNEGETSFNMLLGPTITVFCTVAEGTITSCAFGE